MFAPGSTEALNGRIISGVAWAGVGFHEVKAFQDYSKTEIFFHDEFVGIIIRGVPCPQPVAVVVIKKLRVINVIQNCRMEPRPDTWHTKLELDQGRKNIHD